MPAPTRALFLVPVPQRPETIWKRPNESFGLVAMRRAGGVVGQMAYCHDRLIFDQILYPDSQDMRDKEEASRFKKSAEEVFYGAFRMVANAKLAAARNIQPGANLTGLFRAMMDRHKGEAQSIERGKPVTSSGMVVVADNRDIDAYLRKRGVYERDIQGRVFVIKAGEQEDWRKMANDDPIVKARLEIHKFDC